MMRFVDIHCSTMEGKMHERFFLGGKSAMLKRMLLTLSAMAIVFGAAHTVRSDARHKLLEGCKRSSWFMLFILSLLLSPAVDTVHASFYSYSVTASAPINNVDEQVSLSISEQDGLTANSVNTGSITADLGGDRGVAVGSAAASIDMEQGNMFVSVESFQGAPTAGATVQDGLTIEIPSHICSAEVRMRFDISGSLIGRQGDAGGNFLVQFIPESSAGSKWINLTGGIVQNPTPDLPQFPANFSVDEIFTLFNDRGRGLSASFASSIGAIARGNPTASADLAIDYILEVPEGITVTSASEVFPWVVSSDLNVAFCVPIPGVFLLFTSGIIGLVGLRKVRS
jgi:hypothetical protein